MRTTATLMAACLLAAGCQSVVEDRVEDGLTAAGVPAGMATCMANIWAQDLSVEQIRGISRLASRVRAERSTLTVGRLVEYVRANDPEALTVVTTSAARCAFS